MFTPEQRLQWIKDIYKDEERVSGAIYEGLTIDLCLQPQGQASAVS
jgi:pantetheine-phosphate adenylyltransferase